MALEAQRLQRIRRDHAHLRIRRDVVRPDRIGVKLHELAEAPRPRLLVAPDWPGLVAAKRLGQRIVILRHVARQRRRQIIAQTQPLLVLVLERKHALVRAVLVGQKLAERVGVFKSRRVQRLEPVALIDGADFLRHLRHRAQLVRLDIPHAFGKAGFGARRLLLLFAHQ